MKIDIEDVLSKVFDGVVDAYNTIASVEQLPYATFSVSSSPKSTKDGVYRHDHNIEINVVTGKFDSCKAISGEIIENLMMLTNDDLSVVNISSGIEGDTDIYVNKIECLIIELV